LAADNAAGGGFFALDAAEELGVVVVCFASRLGLRLKARAGVNLRSELLSSSVGPFRSGVAHASGVSAAAFLLVVLVVLGVEVAAFRPSGLEALESGWGSILEAATRLLLGRCVDVATGSGVAILPLDGVVASRSEGSFCLAGLARFEVEGWGSRGRSGLAGVLVLLNCLWMESVGHESELS
jgi:hypothetical protein